MYSWYREIIFNRFVLNLIYLCFKIIFFVVLQNNVQSTPKVPKLTIIPPKPPSSKHSHHHHRSHKSKKADRPKKHHHKRKKAKGGDSSEDSDNVYSDPDFLI